MHFLNQACKYCSAVFLSIESIEKIHFVFILVVEPIKGVNFLWDWMIGIALISKVALKSKEAEALFVAINGYLRGAQCKSKAIKPSPFRVLISTVVSKSKGAEVFFVAINGDLRGVIRLHCEMLALLSFPYPRKLSLNHLINLVAGTMSCYSRVQ